MTRLKSACVVIRQNYPDRSDYSQTSKEDCTTVAIFAVYLLWNYFFFFFLITGPVYPLVVLIFQFIPFSRGHREKLQAHFSDSRSLRDCSVNASGLMSKSTPRLQYSLQFQKVSLFTCYWFIPPPYLYHHYDQFHLNMYSTSSPHQKTERLTGWCMVCILIISPSGWNLFFFVHTWVWQEPRQRGIMV